jgi:hypothetical protein
VVAQFQQKSFEENWGVKKPQASAWRLMPATLQLVISGVNALGHSLRCCPSHPALDFWPSAVRIARKAAWIVEFWRFG